MKTPTRLIGIDELASLVALSAGHLRNTLYKTPEKLPKRTYIPGAADAVRFNLRDVEAWIEQMETGYGAPCSAGQADVQVAPPARRGRPTKAAVMARKLAAAKAN